MVKWLTLGLILVFAIFARFYHLEELFHWTLDEEYWTYIPFNIATNYHFPLIGGSIADTGLYTTPWFVYLMAVVALLGQGNPVAFALFVSGLGITTTFLIFFLGKRVFGARVSLLAALMYAVSTLMSLWDRHYWNASLTPILSVLIMFFLYKIKSGGVRYWLILGPTLALGISAHGTGVALLLFVVLAVILLRVSFKNPPFIFGVIIFLLSFLPLVFFDLRHNFLEARTLGNYFLRDQNNSPSLLSRAGDVTNLFLDTSSRLFFYHGGEDVAKQLTLCSNYANDKGKTSNLATVLVIISLVWGLWKSRKETVWRLIMLQIGATLLGLLIFRSPLSSYYFLPIATPLFFLMAGLAVDVWSKSVIKMIIFPVLVFYVTFNLQKIYFSYHSYGYNQKNKLISLASQHVQNRNFSLEVKSQDQCQLYGWRYLFTFLGQEPVYSYTDILFDWLYEKRLPSGEPSRKLILWIDENDFIFSSEDVP